jgi:hypothetical protein
MCSEGDDNDDNDDTVDAPIAGVWKEMKNEAEKDVEDIEFAAYQAEFSTIQDSEKAAVVCEGSRNERVVIHGNFIKIFYTLRTK